MKNNDNTKAASLRRARAESPGLHTLLVEMGSRSDTLEKFGTFLRNETHTCYKTWHFYLWVFTPDKLKLMLTQKRVHDCS